MISIGKIMVIIGIVFIVTGILLMIVNKGFKTGYLPGDIVIKRSNMTIIFPITTCLLISLLLTILFSLWNQR